MDDQAGTGLDTHRNKRQSLSPVSDDEEALEVARALALSRNMPGNLASSSGAPQASTFGTHSTPPALDSPPSPPGHNVYPPLAQGFPGAFPSSDLQQPALVKLGGTFITAYCAL